MPRTVYGLYFDDSVTGKRCYFYVGQSIDWLRREKQHHYAKRKGHEDKYEFIRNLEIKGIAWYAEALKVIPANEDSTDNERWFVITLTRKGHALMNMRHGSIEYRRELAEQVESPAIRSVSDVKSDRGRRKYAGSRRLRRRILERALRKEGIPNVSIDGLLPPVLRKRFLARGVSAVERGVTLAEIVAIERATPELNRIEAKLRGDV